MNKTIDLVRGEVEFLKAELAAMAVSLHDSDEDKERAMALLAPLFPASQLGLIELAALAVRRIQEQTETIRELRER